MHTIDLIRFNTYVPPIDLTFNQYLLLSDEFTLLIHTGNMKIGQGLLADVQRRLNGRTLDGIFISHFESDECGSIALFINAYPEVVVYCSEVSARELAGFGIKANTHVVSSESVITKAGVTLKFLTYPSEVHLWNGLLLYEQERKILFSSDLVFAFGDYSDYTAERTWAECVDSIAAYQIPNPDSLSSMKETLSNLDVQYIAPGHGPAIEVIK